MTRKKIKKKIVEMETIIAELKEELERAENINPNVFIPEYGEEYWFIDRDGKVYEKIWVGHTEDKNILAIGNVFRTRKEAEFEVERLKVIHELRIYAEPRDTKGDRTKLYCFLTYSSNTQSIYTYFSSWRRPQDIYFASEERAWEAIKTVGKERVKKYYLYV